mgnify:CR=1 FL=1
MRLNTAYPLFLYKNNFTDYDLNSSISYAVHSADPSHLVGGFQLLRYALRRSHLTYQLFEYSLSLLVNVRKIAVQLAAGQQVGIAYTMMFLEIPKMPLTPISRYVAVLSPVVSDRAK